MTTDNRNIIHTYITLTSHMNQPHNIFTIPRFNHKPSARKPLPRITPRQLFAYHYEILHTPFITARLAARAQPV